jgi:pyridoxamine 5'-phosphate oxidase
MAMSRIRPGTAALIAEAEMSPSQSLTERLFGDADTGSIDPMGLFEEWFDEAKASEPSDPQAMALASADPSGAPDVRIVLANQRDERGFCFFTNFDSDKGRQLLANRRAAATFHWKSTRRQVRLRGMVEVVTDAEADAYFASRPLGSRIASAASLQSRPLASRAELERPPHWSGFRLIPTSIEFWREGAHRLHDRFRFTRDAPGAPWLHQRLYP